MTEPEEYKSRTKLKKEMTALQRLGEKLVKLPVKKIRKLDITEELKTALIAAQSITKNEAKRRQMQFIGKLMRDVDQEELESFLVNLDHGQIDEQLKNKHIEQQVKSLKKGDNEAIEELLNIKPDLNRQHLRQLVRNYLKATEKNKSKAEKVLIQTLSE